MVPAHAGFGSYIVSFTAEWKNENVSFCSKAQITKYDPTDENSSSIELVKILLTAEGPRAQTFYKIKKIFIVFIS